MKIRNAYQIPVVGHGGAACLQCVGKHIQMHRTFVELPPQARMDNQLPDGIAVENLQQTGKLRPVVVTDSGLYRHREADFLEYRIEKGVQLVGVE
ncbi:hypothetical protein DSECCO2_362290 [anaerobic digester metagenome]